MARKGLNCSLTYSDGKVLHSYRVRCDQVTHGSVMVYEESQARTRRAFFPHRRAEDKFTINAMLIGQAERRSFVSWLNAYASFVLSTDLAVGQFPPMIVNIPSRNFLKTGVPLTGIEWGTHVGAMVFNHAVIFESVPAQMSINSASRPVAITNAIDPATEYFYPFQNQLSGNQAPAVYTDIIAALAAPPTATDIGIANGQIPGEAAQ
jgi:hypothetical protein